MNKNSYFVSDLECIGGDIINKQKCPRAVSTTCPHCSANAVFSLVNIYQITPIGCWPRHGKCPKCMRSVKFVFFFEDSPSNEAINPSDVAIFPTPQNARRPINLPDDLPQRLKRAIKDTEETFQSGLYSPCLTSGRRALEGIFKQ
ncbi:hypothetical protein, partial [Leisingera sp. MMG026]|uniref:hypothetical protein n=1 Tax=Leisingera sp. MMG026 TaxID=2909982 RepID=UPI001F2DACBE